jgi:hypothetical protein
MGTRVVDVDQATHAVGHSIWLDGPRETAERVGARGYAYAPYAHVGEPVAIVPHVLILYVEGLTSIERVIGRTCEREEVGPGDLSMQSTACPSIWTWARPIEVLHVYISPAHMRHMAQLTFDAGVTGVRLHNQLRVTDPVVAQLGFDLIGELRTPVQAGADVAARAIGDRLLVELLRRHADVDRSDRGAAAFDDTSTPTSATASSSRCWLTSPATPCLTSAACSGPRSTSRRTSTCASGGSKPLVDSSPHRTSESARSRRRAGSPTRVT